MKDIFVLVNPKTGEFFKKVSYGGHQRGVYSFKSESKALATIKMFHPVPSDDEVKVVRYSVNETK